LAEPAARAFMARADYLFTDGLKIIPGWVLASMKRKA
jgi:hypothetical protein